MTQMVEKTITLKLIFYILRTSHRVFDCISQVIFSLLTENTNDRALHRYGRKKYRLFSQRVF